MSKLIIIFAMFFCSTICLSQPVETMRANMYVVDQNGSTLVDGNLTNYHSQWSNTVDINDAWKLINPGMNFSIWRDNLNLVVERRSFVQTTDTTYFKMWNMQQVQYTIRFVCINLNKPGRIGKLYDSYTNTNFDIDLGDTSFYNFRISNDPASANEYRFKVIFTTVPSGPLPVTITSVQASRSRSAVQVKWNVDDEIQMDSYNVERSSNGTDFISLSRIPALNTSATKTYSYTDLTADNKVNFYRIKALSINGKVQYSPVAKISATDVGKDINIYPNPVTNKMLSVQYTNQQAGVYDLTLIHTGGVSQKLSALQFGEGQGSRSAQLPPNLPAGSYYLKLVGPGNITVVKQIQVL